MTTTDANGNKTTILMDDNGQVCEAIDPLGNVTHYTYDSNGDLTQVNGPQGANLRLHLRRQRQPRQRRPIRSASTTQFTYDSHDNLTSYTDAKGNTTSYAYDAANDLLSITYANGTQQTYTYNPLGEATQFLNANGQAIGYTYNAQGHGRHRRPSPTARRTPTPTTPTATSPTATDAARARITFLYRRHATNPDLLTEVEYPDGTFLKFSYNVVGQRTQSVDQTGFTVNYTYDAAGPAVGADRRQRQPDRPVHLRRGRQPDPEGQRQRHAHGLHLRRRRRRAVDHELCRRTTSRSTRSTTTPTMPWATC